MVQGSTHPLTEMSTTGIVWGKVGRCIELTTLPPSWADFLEVVGAPTSWNPRGLSRPVWEELNLLSKYCYVRDESQ
jgi:hypothetical protein